MNTHTAPLLALLLGSLLLSACAEDSDNTEPSEQSNELEQNNTEQADPCQAQVLADDEQLDERLGEQGDPQNWPQLPPNAIVASTYLRLRPEGSAQAAFGEVMGPIIGELMAPAPGLMGMSTLISESCGTARTLSVWESEEAMMKFVVGPAHLNAIQRVDSISRGGSITAHWKVSELEAVRWEQVVLNFAQHDGPVY